MSSNFCSGEDGTSRRDAIGRIRISDVLVGCYVGEGGAKQKVIELENCNNKIESSGH